MFSKPSLMASSISSACLLFSGTTVVNLVNMSMRSNPVMNFEFFAITFWHEKDIHLLFLIRVVGSIWNLNGSGLAGELLVEHFLRSSSFIDSSTFLASLKVSAILLVLELPKNLRFNSVPHVLPIRPRQIKQLAVVLDTLVYVIALDTVYEAVGVRSREACSCFSF